MFSMRFQNTVSAYIKGICNGNQRQNIVQARPKTKATTESPSLVQRGLRDLIQNGSHHCPIALCITTGVDLIDQG